MQEVFSKIIEELEENQTIVFNLGGGKPKQSIDLERAIEIVKREAEKYDNGWIPCSERLPKYGEVVMCSCTNGGITISCITHKGVTPSKSVRFGQHSVIAWQPLPEPFKERD